MHGCLSRSTLLPHSNTLCGPNQASPENEVLNINVIANTDGMRDYVGADLVVHMLQGQRCCETIAHFNEHSSLEGY